MQIKLAQRVLSHSFSHPADCAHTRPSPTLVGAACEKNLTTNPIAQCIPHAVEQAE
jgi:hypothetical protein